MNAADPKKDSRSKLARNSVGELYARTDFC